MYDTVRLKISDLEEFAEQPFKVIDDESMAELVESIKMVGVLVPIIVRKIENGKFEIISGHRRKRACEIAGIGTIPAQIKDLSDDEAAILLVDSNLHRERILPSERAFAYKLKLEAIKHQGMKLDAACGNNVHKSKSRDEIGESFGESGRQVQRYIRLTELIYTLLDKVDEGIITPTAGAEISFLDVKHQVELCDYIEMEDCGISIKQAKMIHKSFVEQTLSKETLKTIFKEEKLKQERLYLDFNKLKSYFPKGYTMKQCEDALWEILDKMKK